MAKVYKVKLEMDGLGTVIPGSPLYVDNQHGLWCCWYLDEAGGARHIVKVLGTGWDIKDERLIYLNSFMEMDGNLVWHAFYYRVSSHDAD